MDRTRGEPDDAALRALFAAITSGDRGDVEQRLASSPGLAVRAVRAGASRRDPESCFLTAIHHQVYAGDTALHIAAAAHRRGLTELLVDSGADVRARNRHGAEPLHYAADGRPGAADWDPAAQAEVIACLCQAGADPNAFNKNGVAPLHRAVRTRASAAVRALILNGADPTLRNASGSTPLHLAVQNTGKSSSGSAAAKEEQASIIAVLLKHGARPDDADAHGRTVAAAASSGWIRDLLSGH